MDAATFNHYNGGISGADRNTDGSAQRSAMDHNLALSLGSTLDEISSDGVTQGELDMINNAITHVVSQTDDPGFDITKLRDGKTSAVSYGTVKSGSFNAMKTIKSNLDKSTLAYEDNSYVQSPCWASAEAKTLTYNIQGGVWRGKGNFTVANIQNASIQEGKGHITHRIPGHGIEHARAYDMQIEHSIWRMTTPQYQRQILNSLSTFRK